MAGRNYQRELEEVLLKLDKIGDGRNCVCGSTDSDTDSGIDVENRNDHIDSDSNDRQRDNKNSEKGGMSKPPSLLLHSCCAPCSSYVYSYLREYFAIAGFYYNPNIGPVEEYEKRFEELEHLTDYLNSKSSICGKQSICEVSGRKDPVVSEIKMTEPVETMDLPNSSDRTTDSGYNIELIKGTYEEALFIETARGLEYEPEGGARCRQCFELRLRRTAQEAVRLGTDFFGTTLTVSPHKNANVINEIGERLGSEYGVRWLPSDFKKRGGYQQSVVLSREYGLYRQNYCGCFFSKYVHHTFVRETNTS
jgi:predicted adenine nucleotide alpha hydrolase (AANH) superfamily ATPase